MLKFASVRRQRRLSQVLRAHSCDTQERMTECRAYEPPSILIGMLIPYDNHDLNGIA